MTRVLQMGESVGTQVALKAECACSPDGRPRRLPIWIQAQTANAIGRQLIGVLRSDLVVLTYKCKCGRKVAVTIEDLFEMQNGPVEQAVSE